MKNKTRKPNWIYILLHSIFSFHIFQNNCLLHTIKVYNYPRSINNTPATKPNWLELPRDVTLNILQRLHTVEIITSACLVCSLWWNFCKDPYIWRTIHIPDFYHRRYKSASWMKMCEYAVDRSYGLLEDIYIYMFANDELLEYIADRASNVRRVRIEYCNSISDEGFIEAVKKLPLIEELDISNNNNLSKHSFEAVGSCCPLLKTLSYGSDVSIDQNDEAFAIAKTMPGLRSLTVSGWRLTSLGVVAILDGCSFLESLDLKNCSSFSHKKSFSESLKKRCCEQIKKFILPPMHEYCCYTCQFDDDDDFYYGELLYRFVLGPLKNNNLEDTR